MNKWLERYRPMWQAPDGGTAAPTPTPADPALGTPTPLPPETPPTPTPTATPDPVQQRFDTLTAQRWAEKRRADAAEARARLAEETLQELRRLEAPEPGVVPSPTPRPAPTPAVDPPGTIRLTEQQLAERVQREAATNEYNRRVNDMVAEGRKVHKDFDEQVTKIKTLTGNQVPESFVVAIMETGKGHDVLHALGGDLQEVDRILQLPPARQAVELTRFADRLAASPSERRGTETPEVSRTPAPIAARVGGGAPARELEIDDPRAADPDKGLSTAEWMRRRNADVAKKRQNGLQIR